MIKVHISGNRADVTEREPLTSGTVGKVLNFAFTEDWRLLIKYAVFEGSGRRIALTNIGDSCIIPHEVLAKHGGALRVGVYGRTADGSAATPTVYAQLGIIQRGADPNADPSTKPTLPVWAQIQAQIGDLSNLTTEDKTNLVAAINEAAKSGGSGSGGGKDGTGIESITYKGEDESGGNMYTVLLTDGTSYDITAPKGAKGDKGDAGGKGADGADGVTPHIGDNGNWYIGNTDTGKPSRGAAGANGKDGAPGKDGAAGSPGITPNIGANGNWYLGTTDTGKPSRGETGLQGPVGPAGPVGPQGPQGEKGADGKSAYQYAQESGYTGTETEFAAKLAEEMPTTLPNPNALTFTGAVTGSYDGSEPLKVEIPSGGGGVSLPLLYDLTTSEEVEWIDTGDNAFLVKNFLFVEMVSVATATNESDGPGSASMYPLQLLPGAMQCPWNNQVVAYQISALMPKNYTKVFRAFCFRGDGGHWTSITSIRNDVNAGPTAPNMLSVRFEGTTDQPMRGLIIGKAFAKNTNVFGVGSRLRVWGV